jgi:esterase/lipase superfamily enzyme
MPELASALPWIVALILAGCLYALVWYASDSLSGVARVLARVAPLAVIVPGIVYLSVVPAMQREALEAEPAVPETVAPKRAKTAKPAPVEASPEVEKEKSASSPPAASKSAPPPSRTTAAKAVDVMPGTSADTGDGGWDIVPVFYGTDRLRQGGGGRVIYGSERARRLELGRALVTVPAAHRMPGIERPFALRVPFFQVVLHEQPEDPRRHFTIKELQVLPRDRFLALVRERIGASRAFRDQALVFIHGFNTAFDHALYRTAQIAYDLEFDGATFLYSWPSGGGVAGYTRDRESATQAELYLREFLTLVVQQTGAKGVSVIAHSMGNLPLLNVLRELGPSLPRGVRLNEIILAAPDVDRDVFANLVAAVGRYGRGITLYCSANDRAMRASRQFAGGVPRAGDVPAEGPVILPGIDTIDVTATSTDLLALNHSVYAEKSALLNDIGLILQTGERPPDRRIPILQKVRTGRGEFWRYP